MITADNFRSSKMRGLNLSMVNNFAQLKAKDIPAAKATGANHGRYWVTIAHDMSNVYSFVDPATLATLDAAIAIAEQQKFYLILTLQIKPTQGQCDIWGNPARKAGIKKIWQQLASHYKDKEIVAAYDLWNEPRVNTSKSSTDPLRGSNKECIDFQIDLIHAIHAIDPNHTIAVEVMSNGMLIDPYIANIAKIPNLIFSPHGYGSYNSATAKNDISVTHQGTSSGFTKRLVYPSTTYPSNMFLSNPYWRVMKDFMDKYKAPVWVGEFSCINWAPINRENQWTSTRWTEDAIKFMESYGISWAYHAWREYEGWDSEIPSSFYANMPYVSAAPQPKPLGSTWRAQRTSTAPTITMLKKYFAKNSTL